MFQRKQFDKLALTIVAGAASAFVAFAAHADEDFLQILDGPQAPAADGKPAARKSALEGVIAKPTAEQNIFVQFFDKGDFEKALYQWPSAFEGTEFAKTPTGRALNGLILFKNGIQVLALESLLAVDQPAKIHPSIVKMWKEVAPDSNDVWSFVNASLWKPAWTEVFGVATEVRVRGFGQYSAEETETVKDLMRKTPRETRERAWLEWQMVLGLALNGDPGTAAKGLAILMKAPNNPVGQDLMTMTAARLLYQNGFLDAAIKYYGMVPKTSDDWFDAQEEMAWAYVRKGEPQDAIAITKTLMTPAFTSQVGPEAVFLRSLALLKVCDYPQVVETLNSFRDRFRSRAKNMVALTEASDTPVVKDYIAKTKKAPVKLLDLKGDAAKLPRFITRDQVLNQMIQTEKRLEQEGQRMGALYARSLSGGTGQVGFQARLDDLRKAMETRVQASRSATYNRVKALAQDEINELTQILQKLHIVEAEVLQQISLADRVSGATKNSKLAVKQGSTGSKAIDTVSFPDDGEIWFDELANYKVDLKKGCQSVTR